MKPYYLSLTLLLYAFLFLPSGSNAQAPYCDPSYTSGCGFGDQIDDVILNNLSRTGTGCSAGDYEFYTADTIQLERSVSYGLTVASGNTYNEGIGGWLDFDQDVGFGDAGEFLGSNIAGSAGTQFTINFTVPMSATLGYTRLRVRANYASAPTAGDSCSSLTYGEAEDYVVEVLPAPSCPQPSNLTSTVLSKDSIELGWTSNGSGTSWQIIFGPQGFTPGSGNGDTVLTNNNPDTLLVDSLIPSYDIYIREICGPSDSSYWTGPYTVTKPCPIFIPPYQQTFDQGFTPECWTVNTPNGSGWEYGQQGDAGYGASSAAEHTGNGGYYAWVDFSGSDDTTYLESPQFDVSGFSNSPELIFWYFSNNTDAPGDNNTLAIQAFNGTSWETIDTIQTDNPDWTKVSYDLDTMIYGGGMLEFRFGGWENQNITGFENDLLLDDIMIKEKPSREFAINSIMAPASSSCNYDSVQVEAEFKNLGAQPQDTIEVGYMIDNGTPVLDTIFTNVAPDSTVVHTFPVTTAFAMDATYQLDVFSSLSGDAFNNNDTLSKTIINGSGSLNPLNTDTNGISDGDFTYETSEFICGTRYEDYNCSRILALEIDSLWHEDALDELNIQLVSPSGTTLDLWMQLGTFSDQSMYNLVFTDTASQNITSATAPFTGAYHPQEAAGFAKFNGEPINGQWTLRVYNDDCCDTAAIFGWSMRVLDPMKPQLDLGADTTICKDHALQLDPGNNPNWSYVWQDNSTDSTYIVAGDFLDTSVTHTYYVRVTDESEFNKCSNTDTIKVNVEYCTSIDENGEEITFSIFPNPANETINIERSGEIEERALLYEVRDLQGRMVQSKRSSDQRTSLDISNLSRGVYFIKGLDNENEEVIFNRKIVIQ